MPLVYPDFSSSVGVQDQTPATYVLAGTQTSQVSRLPDVRRNPSTKQRVLPRYEHALALTIQTYHLTKTSTSSAGLTSSPFQKLAYSPRAPSHEGHVRRIVTQVRFKIIPPTQGHGLHPRSPRNVGLQASCGTARAELGARRLQEGRNTCVLISF